MANFDVKIVLLGNQGVGKTCLMDRFINSRYDAKYRSTVGAGFSAKKALQKTETLCCADNELSWLFAFMLRHDGTNKVALQNGRVVSLGIWDTAGDARFANLTKMYLKGVHAGVVCVCLHQPASYHKAKTWVAQLLEATDRRVKIYIAVTQCDTLMDEDAIKGVQQAFSEVDGVENTSVHGLEDLGVPVDHVVSVPSTQGSVSSLSSLPPSSTVANGSSLVLDGNQASVNVAEHAQSLAAYAGLIKAPVHLTSARNATGITQLFAHIAEDCAQPPNTLQRSESASAASLLMALPFTRKMSVGPRSPKAAPATLSGNLSEPLLGTQPGYRSPRARFGGLSRALRSSCCCCSGMRALGANLEDNA